MSAFDVAQSGFTLVELMIVVSVVGALALLGQNISALANGDVDGHDVLSTFELKSAVAATSLRLAPATIGETKSEE